MAQLGRIGAITVDVLDKLKTCHGRLASRCDLIHKFHS
jgi:hypothetical protein